jgi:hypothetical protein
MTCISNLNFPSKEFKLPRITDLWYPRAIWLGVDVGTDYCHFLSHYSSGECGFHSLIHAHSATWMVFASWMIKYGQSGYFLLIKLMLQLVEWIGMWTTKTRWMVGKWWTKRKNRNVVYSAKLMNDDRIVNDCAAVTAKRNTANPVRNEMNDELAASRTECKQSSRRFVCSDPFNVKWRINADDPWVILTFTWLDIFVCQITKQMQEYFSRIKYLERKSKNLKNEEAVTHVGSQRQSKKKKSPAMYKI